MTLTMVKNEEPASCHEIDAGDVRPIQQIARRLLQQTTENAEQIMKDKQNQRAIAPSNSSWVC